MEGTYKLVRSADKATLVLFKGGTYRFCLQGEPCETATYEVVAQGDQNRIFFAGARLRKFGSGGVGNIQYRGFSCPCISFEDPDSGYRFEKFS